MPNISDMLGGLTRLESLRIEVESLQSREKSLRSAAMEFLSYVATCKQENTDEWMDGLAEYMNKLLSTIGDTDRVRYVGSNVGGYLEIDKVCPEESEVVE